jgi:hypothetical protein
MVTHAVGRAAITSSEEFTLSQMIETFLRAIMRASSKADCGNRSKARLRAAKIRPLYATTGRPGLTRASDEISGAAFYLDCRVGRKAATSPGLRSILSTSLA